MNKKIINTIKLSGAAIIAIIIASLFGLEFAISTGIVAMLTIQPTKKETLKTILPRLMGYVVALVVSYICFLLLGFTIKAFFVFLVVFIGICQLAGWNNAITMNLVLMSHFVTYGDMQLSHVLNETGIFLIGATVGIIANLHLRKNVSYIEELKEETDAQIKNILSRMSERIMDKDLSDYNGDCFSNLEKIIRHAKNVAEENFNNQFGSKDIYDREYLKMREKQCHVLYEMYGCVRRLETTPITAKKISGFLKKMSEEYHKDNTCESLACDFIILDKSMKEKPLPEERKEFEDRAMLYMMLRKIEEFINLKLEFSQLNINQ
ncbi:MAG: hypothetical protein E7259_07070 [Lachnospiraceae bacterium]|nr:hypothetical protein [Lachnospiraceae bacterium]